MAEVVEHELGGADAEMAFHRAEDDSIGDDVDVIETAVGSISMAMCFLMVFLSSVVMSRHQLLSARFCLFGDSYDLSGSEAEGVE